LKGKEGGSEKRKKSFLERQVSGVGGYPFRDRGNLWSSLHLGCCRLVAGTAECCRMVPVDTWWWCYDEHTGAVRYGNTQCIHAHKDKRLLVVSN
jgi:hypothetical protein